jgi:hypothetical protein
MRQNKVAIEQGFKVVIWPEGVPSEIVKDVNQMIGLGYTSKDVLEMFQKNTYSGMQALLVLNDRKRCTLDEGKKSWQTNH